MTRPTKLPDRLGPIHFVGIGGIGMSGIAEVLLTHGYNAQGSDIASTPLTERLESMGARIFLGHQSQNLGNADVVVVSSAIRSDNAELVEARRRGLPVVRRAEMLAELMRLKSNVAVAGTHGKTTTTTIVATLLEKGGFDPTVVNGGIVHAFGSNARRGEGEWMVVEADESDGTFLTLPATVAVITNIDPEHMDHYGSFEKLKAAFAAFISNVPFYGFAVCCTDHPVVRSLVDKIIDRRIVTYGLGEGTDVRAEKIAHRSGGVGFDVILDGGKTNIEGCRLPIPGDYNVCNALAGIAVADRLGMSGNRIREALAGFKGVNRRFTRVGKVNGVEIVDDYAHHPVEIASVLRAARNETDGRVFAIHQPHRYSRLRDLFEDFVSCFHDADYVAITDIYSAGESPLPGISRDALVAGLAQNGHRHATPLAGECDLHSFVLEQTQPGDLVVCLGAGSISAWANSIPGLGASEAS